MRYRTSSITWRRMTSPPIRAADSDVPDGAPHQGDGREDGLVRGGRRRGFRRLPVLPQAPNSKEFHEETVRKLGRLHHFDCLRANKAMAAWGVEARVPFLDVEFLDVAMAIDPEEKMPVKGRIEKQVLRDAFADILPEEVVTRQKEQFSDGVGYGWIDALKKRAEARVSDNEMRQAAVRFPHNTPDTKEAYYYRSVFEGFFPLSSSAMTVMGGKSIACSTPEALAWDTTFAEAADPSGRAVAGVHQAAT